MRRSVLGGVVALSLVGASLLAPGAASASRPTAAAVPVVKVAVVNGQATVTPAQVTPGVVELQVTKNFVIPGDEGGPEAVALLQTADLGTFFQTLAPAFAGDPSDPASMAASAQAMKSVNSMAKAYGGGMKGFTWRVRLPAGTYSVLGIQSAAMGMTQPGTLTVAGAPRAGALPRPQGIIRAIGPVGHNKFVAGNLSRLSDGWLRFANDSHELHFLDMSGVKPGTTNAEVRKSFMSNKQPKYMTGPFYVSEVVSPGVAIAIKGPFKASRYLIDCFIPSEADGMPHALMGMWKLVDVG